MGDATKSEASHVGTIPLCSTSLLLWLFPYMFFGLFFLWSNLFTLIPLIAIPGYFLVTVEEERLLKQRFGEEYVNYQRKTGRFIPRLR